MAKKYFITLLLIGVPSIFAFHTILGQSGISGYVKTSLSGKKPIADVYVEITNIDKPIMDRIVKVDNTGYFMFEVADGLKKYVLKT